MGIPQIVVTLHFLASSVIAFPNWIENGVNAQNLEKFARKRSIQSGLITLYCENLGTSNWALGATRGHLIWLYVIQPIKA